MKKGWILLCLFAAILATPVVFAEEAAAEEEATVSKDEWIAHMVKELGPAVCKDKSYFTTCFGISVDECNKLVGASTQTCSDKLKDQIPVSLNKKSGEEWGSKVGECAGGDFEEKNASKKVDSADCNDPTKWE